MHDDDVFNEESDYAESILQLDRYLNEKREKLGTDSMTFWRKNSERFNHVVKLVKKYHSATPGSVEAERLFSTAGYIVNKKRTSLSDENLERLLFLHHNLPLYNYEY